MTSRITHKDETTNYAERIELHRKAYLERLVIQGYSITGRGESQRNHP